MSTVSDLENEKFNIHLCNTTVSKKHSHSFFELGYVVSGRASHTLDGSERIISAGDYFIMDYNKVHSYFKIGHEDFKIINCLFVSEFIDRSLRKCHNFTDVVNNYMLKHNHTTVNISPANCIFSDVDGHIYTLLSGMLNEFEKKVTGYHEIIRSRLIEIIILAMRSHSGSVQMCTDELCCGIIDYVAENLTGRDLLSSYAAKCNMSVAGLSRRFKAVMGISFSEYLKKKRIEQSLQLLANTDKKVIEIAQICGYSDMKFFNRIFKEQTGVTPREFRKSI